jgi:hypothetical protein
VGIVPVAEFGGTAIATDGRVGSQSCRKEKVPNGQCAEPTVPFLENPRQYTN